MKHKSIVKVVD